MKDRIAHIMRAKNLKATDFAALLGIQPSAVSHILAGRNNPSLEFVKKIKETFPEYNLDWIIFGTGPMTSSEPFKEARKETDKTPQTSFDTATLFDVASEVQDTPTPPQPAETTPVLEVLGTTAPKKVLVLYEDGTFEQFISR